MNIYSKILGIYLLYIDDMSSKIFGQYLLFIDEYIFKNVYSKVLVLYPLYIDEIYSKPNFNSSLINIINK